jgi:hypothetical protein
MASERLADARTGKNGHHALVGMLRQAVFGRLAGYEDVPSQTTTEVRLVTRKFAAIRRATGRRRAPRRIRKER